MTIKERLSRRVLGIPDGTWTRIWTTAIMALALAWPLFAVINAVIDRQPPIRYIEAFAVEPRVEAGGTADIRFDVDRRRICDLISVSRFITDASGTEHVVQGYTRGAETRPGREVYDRTIVVPLTVPPGRAFYQIRLKYGCNFLNWWGWPIEVESPPVVLEVFARQERAAPQEQTFWFPDPETLPLMIAVQNHPLGAFQLPETLADAADQEPAE